MKGSIVYLNDGNGLKKKKRISSITLFITLLLGLLVLGSCGGDGSSDSATDPGADGILTVGPGGEFSSIQAAIDYAKEGYTIEILPGTYNESIVINKNVSIIGAGASTIITGGSSTKSVFSAVTEFFSKATTPGDGVIQIKTSGSSDAPLLIKGILVKVNGKPGFTVSGDLSFIKLDTVQVEGSADSATDDERGFYVDNSSSLNSLTVTNSNFTKLAYGWFFEGTDPNKLVSNVNVTASQFNANKVSGIYAENLGEAKFENIEANGNAATTDVADVAEAAGINITLVSGNIKFNNCIVTNNATGVTAITDGAGLSVKASAGTTVTVDGGTFVGNKKGIEVSDASSGEQPDSVNIKNASIHGSTSGEDVVNNSSTEVIANDNHWGDGVVPGANIAGNVEVATYYEEENQSTPPAESVVINVPADYSTIQNAINIAANGNIIRVAGGEYAVNELIINKAISLLGPYDDIKPPTSGTRGSEAKIVGKITIVSDNVKIKGFTVESPDSTMGIYIAGKKNVLIQNNILNNVGINYSASGAIQAIYVYHNAADISNIIIRNNKITNIGNVNNGSSNKAIFVGDTSNSAKKISDVIIDGNYISVVNAKTTAKGAYGILVNHSSSGIRITNNTISDLNGYWAHAIGLEGDISKAIFTDTPNAVVTGNNISNVFDHKTPSDSIGIFFENNPSGDTITLSNNTISTSVFNKYAASSSMGTVYVDDNYNESNAGGHIWGINAFNSINYAIFAAKAGATVNVAAGTYNEVFDINKRITLQGAGSGDTGTVLTKNTTVPNPAAYPLQVNGATYTYNPVVIISASGIEGNPILLKNLKIEPRQDIIGPQRQVPAILLRPSLDANSTLSTYVNAYKISYLELNNVRVIGTDSFGSSESGVRVDGSTSLYHFVVNNCEFNNMGYGMVFHNNYNSGDPTTVQYVAINNTIFNNNNIKGFYTEKLSDATFNNITVLNNGDTSRTPFNTTIPWDWRPTNAGIDINLKYGAYQNLTFSNLIVTGNGIDNYNYTYTIADQTNYGAGLTIKARNDGSYAANPATLNNVTITGGSFTGNQTAIRFGEPNKANTSPTAINVNGAAISGNNQYGIDNQLFGVSVNALNNTWGSAAPSVNGDVDY